jgi:hydrogenase maturation protease
VVDYGIRGFDLAYALLDPWEAVILVDALPRGGLPGTLYLLEPDLDSMKHQQSSDAMMNPHGMDPVRVLQLAFSIGEVSAKVYVVGCEPEDFGDELEGRMGLSKTVQASIGEAAAMVEGIVGRILASAGMCPA